MAIQFAATPAYPLAASQVRVTFEPTTGNFVRVWVTEAPRDSAWHKKLEKEGSARVVAFEADTRQAWLFDADVGGRFVCAVQEYSKNDGYGGGYKGDPGGFETETLVGTEQTLTLYIGEKFTAPIGVGVDESKLVLWVWDATIRATTMALHGEVSPRIDAGPTAKAANAARASAVTTALASLVDVAAVTAIGSLDTVLADFIPKFNSHLTMATVHFADDTDNAISNAFVGPYSAEILPKNLAAIFERVDAHFRNDARAGAGPVAGYHGKADNANALLAGPPGDIASSYILVADIWRAFEAHRVTQGSPETHDNPDATDVLAALPKLLDVHRYYLAELAKQAPAAAPGQQTAGALLAAIGMTKG